MSEPKRRAVFFDRDGVINDPPATHYLTNWRDFRFREGARETVRFVKERGLLVLLVTNQKGVAKGAMTQADLDGIHGHMQESLGEAAFDAIFVATDDGGPNSRCKPSPAMLLEAADRFDFDLANCWMVGDDDRDILAGRAAGVGTIRLLGEKTEGVTADHRARDHAELRALLERLITP